MSKSSNLPDFTYPLIERPPARASFDRTVFLHIAKTAGSSVHNILAKTFGSEVICPDRGDTFHWWKHDDLSTFRLFSAHTSVRGLKNIPRPFRTITFLRNPQDRIVSAYRYLTSFKKEAIDRDNIHFARAFKGLGLKEALNDTVIAGHNHFYNKYLETIAGDPYFAPSGRRWIDENEMLDVALQNLSEFDLVGISERFDESISHLEFYTGWKLATLDGRVNETDRNKDLDPCSFQNPYPVILDDELLEAIDKSTRFDQIIYAQALQSLNALRKGRKLFWSLCGGPGVELCQISQTEWYRSTSENLELMYGPYASLPPGRYIAEFQVRADFRRGSRPRPAPFSIDVCSDMGKTILASKRVDSRMSRGATGKHMLLFDVPLGSSSLEFRAWTHAGKCLSVSPEVAITAI